jgi:asparagine synthase (glutamine-hydrolysing)
MCGIAGIVGPFGSNVLADKINRMLRLMVHRGPDSGGTHIDEHVALGNRRLAIIDLDKSANQPFFDISKRYSLIFNGEIYNFKEIKLQLKEYCFQTSSDTEVILAAYLKWGYHCVEQFNGIFAFALWDNNEKKLFIARDRLGVKPLYYFHYAQAFIFASEIRAIKGSGLIKLKLDSHSISDYLMNLSVSAPHTLFEDIYQLMPGQYGVFKNGALSVHDYWQIEAAITFPDIDNPAHVKKEIRRLLTESVEKRMISDVSIGAFLSGGIDSSIIVGLMSEISNQPVNTFSVGFDEKEFDESGYVDLVAKRFNTRHTSITLNPNDLLSELPYALKAMDTPSGDAINTFILSKFVKSKGFSVAMSGVGGDELFAGYPNFKVFHKMKNARILNTTPYSVRYPIGLISHVFAGSKGKRLAEMLKAKNFNIENQYSFLRQVFSKAEVQRIISPKYAIRNPIEQILTDRKNAINQFPFLSQYSIAELLGYTQNILLKDADQMGMANSLEIREPFFDFRLIEFVLQIPDKLKYPRYPKKLLVEALSPILPGKIAFRPKMGFSFPWEKWLRQEPKDFCELHINSLANRELFSKERLKILWNDFLQHKNGVKWSQIWVLVVLEAYINENLS